MENHGGTGLMKLSIAYGWEQWRETLVRLFRLRARVLCFEQPFNEDKPPLISFNNNLVGGFRRPYFQQWKHRQYCLFSPMTSNLGMVFPPSSRAPQKRLTPLGKSCSTLWEDMILIDDVPIEQDLFLIWSRFLLEVFHVSFGMVLFDRLDSRWILPVWPMVSASWFHVSQVV